MRKKGNKVLWISVISVIIGALGTYFGYMNYKNQQGGTMNATYQTRLINNGETKTIVVCLEDNTISLNELPITPTFENPNGYSLKDFSLTFETECTNVTITPSTVVEVHSNGGNKTVYKYHEKVLAAYNETYTPFSCIKLNSSKGHCLIKSKASYNGIQSAFEYFTDVWFFVVPNRGNLSFDQWTRTCEEFVIEQLLDEVYDFYCITKNHQQKYEFDISHGGGSKIPIIEKDDIVEKENVNNNFENVPKTTNSAETPIVSSNIGIEQCHVLRTDSTLSYCLSLESNNVQPGLYLIEGRHKQNSKNHNKYKYEYTTINIGCNNTARTVVYYRNCKAPEIDQVSLYPQSINDDVISIEKKGHRYTIKNNTKNLVVCYVHYSNNSYSKFMLNGGDKTRLKNIGVSPIQAFKTDRKKAEKSFESIPVWIIVLAAGLVALLAHLMESFF